VSVSVFAKGLTVETIDGAPPAQVVGASSPSGSVTVYAKGLSVAVFDKSAATASGPAWRQGLPIGQFVAIPGTGMASLGVKSVTINAWNGLVPIPDGRWVSPANGGHADSSDNGVYQIDLGKDAPAWSVLLPCSAAADIPTLAEAQAQPTPFYKDGRPASRHSYFSGRYIAQMGVVYPFAAALWGAANAAAVFDRFDLTANKWDAAGTNPHPIPSIANLTAATVAHNPATGDIYVASVGWSWFKWTFATKAWSTLKLGTAVNGGHCEGLVDVARNRLMIASITAITCIDLTTLAVTMLPLTGIDGEVKLIQDSAFVHDTDLDQYYVSDGTRVFRIDPATGAAVKVATTPAATNNVEQRFCYFPALRGIAYLPNFASNILFMATADLVAAPAPAPDQVPAPDPAPAPAPAPAPSPAQATSAFPQYAIEDSGIYGPTRIEWNHELQLPWPAYVGHHTWYYGNWLDASDAPQGTVAYQTLTLGPALAPGYVEVDVTALAQKWAAGHNKGIYLRSEATKGFTAFAQVAGRLSANPPQLVVDGVTLTGTVASFMVSTSAGTDTRQSAKLIKGTVGLLHFPDFKASAVQNATLRLYVMATDTTTALTLQLMQTDPPYCYSGTDGSTPVPGIAQEAGEANLPMHPDVFEAGDFRKSNWFTTTDSLGAIHANAATPSPLGTLNSCPAASIVGYELDFTDDPDYPGTQYIRPSMVHGLGRIADTSSLNLTGQWATLPNLSDPLRAIDPATVVDEMFVRAYLMLEDNFWTTVDGVKGCIGFDARSGYWMDGNGGYWQNTTGNSGSKGTGLKVVSVLPAANGRYEYQGHSIRQHMGECRPSGTPYQNYRPLLMMASHLGPYENTPYGTEEIINCGTAVLEKGVWHCIEWRMKMNSIVGPFDSLGNGTAVHDGIMEAWVDGVHRWAKTDFAWRRHPEMGINGPLFLTMHGGTVPAAPGEVMRYRLNSYAAAKRYIGPRS